jgi:hypothetical protein
MRKVMLGAPLPKLDTSNQQEIHLQNLCPILGLLMGGNCGGAPK